MAVAKTRPYAGDGRVLHELSTGGYQFLDVLYPPQLSTEPHLHTEDAIVISLAGSVRQFYDAFSHDSGFAIVSIIPAGVTHREEFSLGFQRALIMTTKPSGCGSPGLLAAVYARPCAFFSARVAILAQRIVEKLITPSPETSLELLGLGDQILAETFRVVDDPSNSTNRPWIETAVMTMRTSPFEPHTASSLASACGMSATYFARAFRERIGCTVTAFRMRLRIEEAARKVAAKDTSLAEIARDCGFPSQAHFTRSFRSIVGISPGRFRKMSRTVGPL